MFLVTQRVTGGGVFQTDSCSDIARVHDVDILTVVRVHLQNTADTFVLVFIGVIHGGTGFQRTRVHTEKRQFTDERVGSDLERQRRKGFIIRRIADFFLFGVRIDALNSGNIDRSGHIFDDRIEQFLNTFVTIGSTAANRNHVVCQGCFTDAAFDFFNGEFVTREVFLQQFVILFGNRFHQRIVVFLRFIQHIRRNFLAANVFTYVVIVHVSFHFDEVNQPFKGIFRTDRQLDRDRITFQAVFHHVDNAIEVGAHDVHFVDVRHTRNFVFVRLTPNRFGLGFDAALCTEHGDRTVENAQRTLHFDRKVHVAGGVDDVNSVVFPETSGRSRGDGNTTLLFLRHPVHRRRTVVGFAQLVVDTRVEQDTFGGGGFTGIDVSHDANVSGMRQIYLPSHNVLLISYSLRNGRALCPNK